MFDTPQMPTHGGEIFRIARELGVKPSELVDMSASINPLGIPESVKNAIHTSIDDLKAYPDSACTMLKKALSEHLCIPVDNILPANGSTELISLIPRLAARTMSKKALLVAPCFSEYERALLNNGWEISFHTLSPDDRFDLQAEKLKKSLKKDLSLLFIANPGNPSGKLYNSGEISDIVKSASQNGLLTVLDEAFIDFAPEHSLAAEISFHENLIILRSMTKFYAIPGLRLGYAISSSEIITELNKIKDKWSVNTIAQKAGIAALFDYPYQEETRITTARLRSLLRDKLYKIDSVEVISGDVNYLFIKLTGSEDAETIYNRLLKQRIIVRRCENFRGVDNKYLRIAIKSEEETVLFAKVLSEALKR